jgi:hypothetical protein
VIEFDEAWNQKNDPQRQTPAGFCKVCGGEIFELDTLDAYDGLCPACWWAENGEEYDGENSGCHGRAANDRPYGGTDSSTSLRGAHCAPLQNDEGGEGD